MSELDPSSAAFFEEKYVNARGHDPWDFAQAPYELQRYEAVMDTLRGRRYTSAFEPGCSVGVLTERLASICDAVYACDFSSTAVERAQERCRGLAGVTVACEALDENAEWSRFDLIVLCEIGYYFSASAWETVIETMVRSMQPGTVLLASHWLGTSKDHRQTGDAVHAAINHPLLQCTLEDRKEGFRLQRWIRTS